MMEATCTVFNQSVLIIDGSGKSITLNHKEAFGLHAVLRDSLHKLRPAKDWLKCSRAEHNDFCNCEDKR